MCLREPAVSVIVPAYNAQNTIVRCIDSILNQTFQDLELIVVDDGSTDHTESILKQYAFMDMRIKLLVQTNNGASAARNAGMQCASGRWITFVDADDYLELDCLKEVLSNVGLNQYDLIFWNYYRVQPTHKESPVIFKKGKGHYRGEALVPYVLDNNGNQGLSSVYCRLFQRKLILKYNLLFQEGVISNEDRLFMVDYLIHAEHCLGLTGCLYNRTLNADSMIHRWHQNAKEEYLLSARLMKERLLHTKLWNMCQNAFNRWILQDIVSLYLETNLCHLQNGNSKERRKKDLYLFLNEKIIDESLRQLKYRDLSIRTKIKFIAVKYGMIDILDRWYQHKDYFMY